jgi:hypothetical protein
MRAAGKGAAPAPVNGHITAANSSSTTHPFGHGHESPIADMHGKVGRLAVRTMAMLHGLQQRTHGASRERGGGRAWGHNLKSS